MPDAEGCSDHAWDSPSHLSREAEETRPAKGSLKCGRARLACPNSDERIGCARSAVGPARNRANHARSAHAIRKVRLGRRNQRGIDPARGECGVVGSASRDFGGSGFPSSAPIALGIRAAGKKSRVGSGTDVRRSGAGWILPTDIGPKSGRRPPDSPRCLSRAPARKYPATASRSEACVADAI